MNIFQVGTWDCPTAVRKKAWCGYEHKTAPLGYRYKGRVCTHTGMAICVGMDVYFFLEIITRTRTVGREMGEGSFHVHLLECFVFTLHFESMLLKGNSNSWIFFFNVKVLCLHHPLHRVKGVLRGQGEDPLASVPPVACVRDLCVVPAEACLQVEGVLTRQDDRNQV